MMSMKSPHISKTCVIANNAQLAAQVCCHFASPGAYLPVMDGSRLTRQDLDAEAVRRNNAVGRAKPSRIILAGLCDESCNAIMSRFEQGLRGRIQRISAASDLDRLPKEGTITSAPPLDWGRDRIGIGLLKALRARIGIRFANEPSPVEDVPSRSGHLVICEDGNELSQVIAANYAFAFGAGLHFIPESSDLESQEILERFYSVYDQREVSATDELEKLKRRLRDRCGQLAIPPGGSLTFVTKRLPYGFAFPEAPSTHLFSYPDFGISIINGLAREQGDSLRHRCRSRGLHLGSNRAHFADGRMA